ncbi:MAG: imidazole glycerol phosphate synthase subunit HisH, partial [Flavipsychrobacter sp.]
MKVVIIKYNAGNVFSVDIALQRLGITPIISEDPKEITTADKVIFPGVGAASAAMQFLKERKLDMTVKALTQPVLGICLGMQLLCSRSEEGNTDCLSIFPEVVKRFTQTTKTP